MIFYIIYLKLFVVIIMFELHSDRGPRPYHFKERYLLFSKIIFSDLTSKR